MLCGISVVFNSLGDILGLMSCKRSSKNGQVLVGFQSTEAGFRTWRSSFLIRAAFGYAVMRETTMERVVSVELGGGA
jgi:hypothetical protein